MMMALLYILALGLVARWVITAVQDRGRLGPDIVSRDAQIKRLRDEVDALSTEVRRLAEEQSFVMRLLEGGTRESAALPPAEPTEISNRETS